MTNKAVQSVLAVVREEVAVLYQCSDGMALLDMLVRHAPWREPPVRVWRGPARPCPCEPWNTVPGVSDDDCSRALLLLESHRYDRSRRVTTEDSVFVSSRVCVALQVCFAHNANQGKMCCPKITVDGVLAVKEGRHPILDGLLAKMARPSCMVQQLSPRRVAQLVAATAAHFQRQPPEVGERRCCRTESQSE